MFITPPQYSKIQGIQLTGKATEILNNSFIMLILGPPGSGKSTFIEQVITKPEFYGGKFDDIIFIGPTKYLNLDQDQSNTLKQPDANTLYEYISHSNLEKTKQYNLLLVFDDCITQLKSKASGEWKPLFFNRRHLIQEGTISILLTSQKFLLVPPWLRSIVTECVIFKSTAQDCGNYNRIFVNQKYQNLIQQRILNLPKYQFIYHNIQKNELYDHLFESLTKKNKLGSKIIVDSKTTCSDSGDCQSVELINPLLILKNNVQKYRLRKTEEQIKNDLNKL